MSPKNQIQSEGIFEPSSNRAPSGSGSRPQKALTLSRKARKEFVDREETLRPCAFA